MHLLHAYTVKRCTVNIFIKNREYFGSCGTLDPDQAECKFKAKKE